MIMFLSSSNSFQRSGTFIVPNYWKYLDVCPRMAAASELEQINKLNKHTHTRARESNYSLNSV